MRVRFFWPDCTYRNHRWGASPVDAFFVEATEQEAAACILPLLPQTGPKEVPPAGDRYARAAELMGDRTRTCCFLVARDLSTVDRFSPHYPIANQWNGDSPFRDMPEITITTLTELREIVLPPLPDPLPDLP